MARYDDLDTTAIAYTTFVSTVILLLIILLGRAMSYAWIEAEDDRKLSETRYVSSDRAIREQLERIGGYRKVKLEVPVEPTADGEPIPSYEQKLHIPIDKARDLILNELSPKPSA
jgi:hypothetical protein